MDEMAEQLRYPEVPDDQVRTLYDALPPMDEGRYGFTCEWNALQLALAKFGPRPSRFDPRSQRRKKSAFRLEPAKERKPPKPVPLRFVIYPDRVTFAAAMDGMYIETGLPLVGPVTGFAARLEPVSFTFDLNVLVRLASAIVPEGRILSHRRKDKWEGDVVFLYQLSGQGGTPELSIRGINLSPIDDIVTDEFVSSLGNITEVAVFDPRTLHRGLYHARLFAKRTTANRNLTVIEARNGAVLGADETGFCMFESPTLRDVALRVGLKQIGVFRRVLTNLDPTTVRLLDCPTHHILQDHLTFFAWPKTDAVFPALEGRMDLVQFDNHIIVSRERLGKEFRSLKVVPASHFDALVAAQDDKKDFLPAEHDGKAIQLKVGGDAHGARMALHIRDGRNISKGHADDIDCFRSGSQVSEDGSAPHFDVMVDLASFLQVVEHFRGDDVCFSVSEKNEYLLIEDRNGDDQWRARTYLSLVSHRGRKAPTPRPSRRRRRSARGG